ncbi:MAG TPA: FHA domain-containing protein [Dehalococcoidia bacterium]|nr:FHA domain-containing protein [Dehalococcoidia bacterium]
MTIRLRVTSNGGQGREIEVESISLLIGRDPECDLVLDSIFVSRCHARLCRKGDGYEITDLESRNGIEINGQAVERAADIEPGDAFTIGPFELQILERPMLAQVTQDFTRLRDIPSLVVDDATHEVFIKAAPVRPPLSRLEFRLIALLHEANGAVQERDRLGNAIWGEGQWDVNMLHRLVHRLKEKIEARPDQPRYIVTVAGVGYRLQSD